MKHETDEMHWTQQPEEPSGVRYVFFGPEGLRAGWGLLLFLVIFVGMVRLGVYGAIAAHVLPSPHTHTAGEAPKPERPGVMLVVEGLMAFSALAATWIVGRIEGRGLGRYGFAGRGAVGKFLLGWAWGLGFLALLVGALWKAGLLVFDGRLLVGGDAWKYGAVWLVGFGLVAMAEESILRGYVQVTLGRGLASLWRLAFDETADSAAGERARAVGFWVAAALLSFVFGAGHGSNPGESPVGLVSAGLIGLVFCLVLWRTGSLWWAIGFHAGWDWAQSFCFGVADSGTMVQFHWLGTHPVGKVLWSGGATGPEGSALVLGVVVLIVGVVWTLPKKEYVLPDGPATRGAVTS